MPTVPKAALDEFRRLLDEATHSDPRPTAMTLATADAARPRASRIVLLKGVDEHGFATSQSPQRQGQGSPPGPAPWSGTGKHLGEGRAGACRGRVGQLSGPSQTPTSPPRPRGSQIGAWASLRSQTLPQRGEFEARLAAYEREFDGRGCRVRHVGWLPAAAGSGRVLGMAPGSAGTSVSATSWSTAPGSCGALP